MLLFQTCHLPLSFFNQTRHAFFSTSLMFQACAEACTCDRTPYMPKPAKGKIRTNGNKETEVNICGSGKQNTHSNRAIIQPIERESFTLSCSIEKFRYYLVGDTFTAQADHEPPLLLQNDYQKPTFRYLANHKY